MIFAADGGSLLVIIYRLVRRKLINFRLWRKLSKYSRLYSKSHMDGAGPEQVFYGWKNYEAVTNPNCMTNLHLKLTVSFGVS
jgi:hypothetical protein